MNYPKRYTENWKNIAPISSGGQGTTLKVERIGTRQIGAVKVLNRQDSLERRARFFREAACLRTLSHELIPSVIETNSEHWENVQYKLYIITEFIEGCTLSNADLAAFSFVEKILCVRKICEVIDYCHRIGYVHRDIKPDNIILKNKDYASPVLIDFGLTFNFEDDDDDLLTPTGQQLGNRFLILPEQKLGETSKRDFRSDITFIVGLLYYILTDQHPIVLSDENNRKPHQRKLAKALLNSFESQTRDLLNHIFDVGFNQIINNRWQSVKSLMEMLDRIIEPGNNDKSDLDQAIDQINIKVKTPEHEEAALFKKLSYDIYLAIAYSIRSISKKAHGDWDTMEIGVDPTDDILYKKIRPINTADHSLTTETVIRAYSTGNEIVINVFEENEPNQIHELLRQSISYELDLTIFMDKLIDYFILQLGKRLS